MISRNLTATKTYDDILAESFRTPLSSGLYGDTFTAEGGHFVIKSQRESPKFRMEKAVYSKVDKLKTPLQDMFVRLLAFRRIPDCKLHRRTSRIRHEARRLEVRQLNKPGPCIELLLENKGTPFSGWLESRMPSSDRMTYSFIGQLVALHVTMYQMGFMHNDLHFENVLITKTTAKSVHIKWQKEKLEVPFEEGRMLVAIDYGETTLAKKGDYRILLEDILENIGDLVLKRYEYSHKTSIIAQQKNSTLFVFPARVIKGISEIVKKYPNVITRARAHAVLVTESFDSIFQQIEDRKIVKRAGEVVTNPLIRHAVRRIQNEMQLVLPEEYQTLFVGEEEFHRNLLSKEEIRALLEVSNIGALVRVLSAKLS